MLPRPALASRRRSLGHILSGSLVRIHALARSILDSTTAHRRKLLHVGWHLATAWLPQVWCWRLRRMARLILSGIASVCSLVALLGALRPHGLTWLVVVSWLTTRHSTRRTCCKKRESICLVTGIIYNRYGRRRRECILTSHTTSLLSINGLRVWWCCHHHLRAL